MSYCSFRENFVQLVGSKGRKLQSQKFCDVISTSKPRQQRRVPPATSGCRIAQSFSSRFGSIWQLLAPDERRRSDRVPEKHLVVFAELFRSQVLCNIACAEPLPTIEVCAARRSCGVGWCWVSSTLPSRDLRQWMKAAENVCSNRVEFGIDCEKT